MGCGAGAQRSRSGELAASEAEAGGEGEASSVANAWADEDTAARELERRASIHSKLSDAKIDELDPKLRRRSSSSIRSGSAISLKA
mmetsp:Transcript_13563/g.39034  ORF Transcript_13563/g.39034 Transcript_13563/m.39034 type:complete len:86 (-) Transcript_13563:210-467(-)